MTENDPITRLREKIMSDPDFDCPYGSSIAAREAEIKYYETVWGALVLFGGHGQAASEHLGISSASMSRIVKRMGWQEYIEILKIEARREEEIAKLRLKLSELESDNS